MPPNLPASSQEDADLFFTRQSSMRSVHIYCIMYMSVAVIYNICILYSKLNIWCICHIQVRHIVLNIEYILAKGEQYCTVFTVVIKQNIWGKM